MFPVEIDKEYDVRHPRKGFFRIRIDKLTDQMIEATITQGKARYISETDRVPGQRIELNRMLPGLVLTSLGV